MARYYDSGSDDKADCLGAWLERNVTSDIRSFRGQFGYYRFAAMAALADDIGRVGAAGAAVHLVLGSNSGFLTTDDVKRTWDIVSGAPDASLTIVAFADAEFHPKTLHLTRADASITSIVGSANFTPSGLGRNVEAFVELDTALGDALTTIQQIAVAIDRWRQNLGASVFPITSYADADDLASAGIINVTPPPRTQLRSVPIGRPPSGSSSAGLLLVRRRPIWRPAKSVTASQYVTLPALSGNSGVPPRWCKKLPASDVLKPPGKKSNNTGKLRLTKAKFGIDQTNFFRNQLFGNATWNAVSRRGKAYEEAEISFMVRVSGVSRGVLNLKIDHAAHREAGQGNITTVLAWGALLGAEIRANANVGD